MFYSCKDNKKLTEHLPTYDKLFYKIKNCICVKKKTEAPGKSGRVENIK